MTEPKIVAGIRGEILHQFAIDGSAEVITIMRISNEEQWPYRENELIALDAETGALLSDVVHFAGAHAGNQGTWQALEVVDVRAHGKAGYFRGALLENQDTGKKLVLSLPDLFDTNNFTYIHFI